MENSNSQLWVDKYRPDNIEDYVLDPEIKNHFRSMIEKKSLQNMALVGVQGSGKTTLAKILAKAFDAETLFIPCATDGTVDILRTKISEFCNALSLEGRQKIVILDEIDSASQTGQNSFQAALRTLIEAAQDDTRFIVTGNFQQKIIQPILSRCPIVPLRFDKKDLLLHVKKILDMEKTEYSRDALGAFIDLAFQYYPDCRRIVNYLQFCASSGRLDVDIGSSGDGGAAEFLDSLIEKMKTETDLLKIRQFYMHGVKDRVSDYVEFGSMLYGRLMDRGLVTIDGAVKLTDFLYQLNTVIDKECGLFGMVCAAVKYMNR